MTQEVIVSTKARAMQFIDSFSGRRAFFAVSGILLVFLIIVFVQFFKKTNRNLYADGLAKFHEKNFDQAVKLFSQALEYSPSDHASRFGLGWAYQAKGWKKEALQQYETAIKGASDTLMYSAFNAGVIQQEARQLNEAVRLYLIAEKINPQFSSAFLNLGLVYLDLAKNELALEQFGRYLQLDPKSAVGYFDIGIAYERLGKREEAKKNYKQSLQIDPKNLGALQRLNTLSTTK